MLPCLFFSRAIVVAGVVFPPHLPASAIWALALIGFSLILWLGLRRTRWGAAVGWLALALAGQCAALQLLDVGPRIKLQLFHEWAVLLSSFRAFFLLVVLVQAVIVLAGARRVWPAVRAMVARLFTWRRGLIFLALAACAAITLDPDFVRAFYVGGLARPGARQATQLGLALLLHAIAAANLFLAAASLPAEALERLATRWTAPGRNRWPWLCALWVVAVSSFLGIVVLERMPHIPDEVAYVFQAKYLAAGHLYLPPPPDPKAFECRFCVLEGGKWFSGMLGGWALVLAAGSLAGVPWLVNPLLGGLGVLLAYALARRLYDPETALGATFLLAGSPWLLFMSANLMPHTLSLALTLLGLLGVQRAREEGGVGWAAVAGLAFGALLHVRPLEAVALSAAAGLWWLSAGWARLRIAPLGVTAASGLAIAALFLAYNRALTGDPFLAPVNLMFDRTVGPGANRLGFGADIGNFGWPGLDALPGHGPVDVLVNTNHNLYMLDFELFGWACGSLLFILLMLAAGKTRGRGLMFGLLLSIWVSMSLYWFSGGPDFGARYWYQMIFPLAVLTASAMRTLGEMLDAGDATLRRRVAAFAALATLLGLLAVVPWRSLDKYPNYRGMRADIRRLQKQYGFGRSLVLIRGEADTDYPAAFAFNPPVLHPEAAGPIYAIDAGPESRQRLLRAFPGRAVWILAAPSVTGRGYEVVEGPLEPGRD